MLFTENVTFLCTSIATYSITYIILRVISLWRRLNIKKDFMKYYNYTMSNSTRLIFNSNVKHIYLVFKRFHGSYYFFLNYTLVYYTTKLVNSLN